jgi:N-acyl-D-amino-acid deacylase
MMFDLVVKGGQVVDGTGNPFFRADVAIQGGKIAKVGRVGPNEAERSVDATGLVVTPGFIDIHSHSDLTVLINPKLESSVRQGVTTEVVGNCGFSCAPITDDHLDLWKQSILGIDPDLVSVDWHSLEEYLHRVEKQGASQNLASLMGHGTLRIAVMGFENRMARPDEVVKMKGLLDEGLTQGAFGLSSGLEYPPGSFADTTELIELCEVVSRHGGFYSTHVRNMNVNVVEATAEAIEIGEKSGVPVQISHEQCYFPAESKGDEVIALIENAREGGVDVTFDEPYCGITSSAEDDEQRPTGFTLMTQMLPAWATDGGADAILQRLRDRDARQKIKEYREPITDIVMWPRRYALFNKWGEIFLQNSRSSKALIGRSMAEIAKVKGVDPYDAAMDIIAAEGRDCFRAIVTARTTTMDHIRKMAKHTLSMVASDGIAVATYGPLADVRWGPHLYGHYPMIFRKFVFKDKLLTLEDAVRKCTSFPANRLGIRDRGLIREGMAADITVFDPKRIEDKGTFQNPNQYPAGIEYVFVNGSLVIDKEKHTGAVPGQVLRSRREKM